MIYKITLYYVNGAQKNKKIQQNGQKNVINIKAIRSNSIFTIYFGTDGRRSETAICSRLKATRLPGEKQENVCDGRHKIRGHCLAAVSPDFIIANIR